MPRHADVFVAGIAAALAATATTGCTTHCGIAEYECWVANMALYDRDGYELQSWVVDADVVVSGLAASSADGAAIGPKLSDAPTGPLVVSDDDPVAKLTLRYENPFAAGGGSSTSSKPLAGSGDLTPGWGCFGIPHGRGGVGPPVSRALATLVSTAEEVESDSTAPEPDDEEGDLQIQVEFDFELFLDEWEFDLDLIPFVVIEGGDDLEAAVQDAANLVLGPPISIPMVRVSDAPSSSGSSSGSSTGGAGVGEFCASQSECAPGLVCSSGTACLYSSISGRCDCVELGQQCQPIPGLDSCVPAGGETQSNACCPGSILVNAVCKASCP